MDGSATLPENGPPDPRPEPKWRLLAIVLYAAIIAVALGLCL